MSICNVNRDLVRSNSSSTSSFKLSENKRVGVADIFLFFAGYATVLAISGVRVSS